MALRSGTMASTFMPLHTATIKVAMSCVAARTKAQRTQNGNSHLGRENAPTVVFEGFMDMLSFATLCGEVRHNYVVLNSIVNTDAAIEVLKAMEEKIYLCLDNDKGGDDATKRILDVLPSAVDIRGHFAPAKDVNDYLLKKNIGKNLMPH